MMMAIGPKKMAAAWLAPDRGRPRAETTAMTMAAHPSDNDVAQDDERSPGLVTFSASICTDIPFYEAPGVSFDEYISNRPRVFRAMFPDERRSKRLNDEEWRIQMLPLQFLFASVRPVVVMRVSCKSGGIQYPPGVPSHATTVLDLQATKWELQGLDAMYMPSNFTLSVLGVLYPDRRGGQCGRQSRLKGHLEMSISMVLPPVLTLVPEDILRGAAETVLKRLMGRMKQEVDVGLLSDFGSFTSEKLRFHRPSARPPASPTEAPTTADDLKGRSPLP